MSRVEKVIALMADGRPRTAEDIATKIGMPKGAVEDLMDALMDRRAITSATTKGVRVFSESYRQGIAVLQGKGRSGPTAEEMAAERERLARKAGDLKRDGFAVRHIAAILGVSETTARRYVGASQ
jgi:predicted ArsR family transcriptional regulator